MINTGGFQVSVMPQTGLVNPQYAIPDPMAVSKGLEASFQVATDQEKLRALKALNDEVAQLREDRVNAARLGYQAGAAQSRRTIATEPGRTAVDLGDINKSLTLQPGDLQNAITRQQIESGNLKFDQRVLPLQQDTRLSSILTDKTIQPDVDAARIHAARTAAIGAEGAENRAALGNSVEQQKLENELQNAYIAYRNDPTNATLKQNLVQAQIREANARSSMYEQHGNYYDARTSGKLTTPGAATAAMLKEERQHQSSIANDMRQVVGAFDNNGQQTQMTLAMYHALSRNGNGTIKEGFRPGEDNYNQAAEDLLKEVDWHRGAIQELHASSGSPANSATNQPPLTSWPAGIGQRGVPSATPTAPVVNPAAPRPMGPNGGQYPVDVSYLSPEQQDAYFWATSPENRDNPKAAAILATLPSAPREQ